MNPKLLTCGLILCSLAAISCHSASGDASAGWPGVPDSAAAHLQGAYSGKFKSGLMTLVINYVSGNTVSGYDLHKGVRRNVNGEIGEKDGRYALVLKEPGGNPLDGTFYLSADKAAGEISGRWVPTDSSRTHSAAVTLIRGNSPKKETGENDDSFSPYDRFDGDLGTLTFPDDNTCKLEYYPDSTADAPEPQLVTLKGNYIRKADTVLIDWQNNKHTPALHMRLIFSYKLDNDSFKIDQNLHGNGVKFVLNTAG